MKSEISTKDRSICMNGKKNNKTENFQFKDEVRFEILQTKPKGRKCTDVTK